MATIRRFRLYEKHCPNCNSELYLSNLDQSKAVCKECNEIYILREIKND
jgi:acetyl-CoA carboxylase beta subunit